jgi:hypothetical protein
MFNPEDEINPKTIVRIMLFGLLGVGFVVGFIVGLIVG